MGKYSFRCSECDRYLPKMMETAPGTSKCEECFPDHKEEREPEVRSSSNIYPRRKTRPNTHSKASRGHSAEPEIRTDIGASEAEDDPSGEESTDSSISISEVASTGDPLHESARPSYDTQTLYAVTIDAPKTATSNRLFPVFALGLYDNEFYQRHAYSQRILAFAKQEEMGLLDWFATELDEFGKLRLDPSRRDFDMATIYPGHKQDSVANPLVKLTDQFTASRNLEYRQVLRRSETRPKQRFQSSGDRYPNQRGSIEVTGDVQGENIILFDDICTSGSSMFTGVEALYSQGANLVIGVVLGLSEQPGRIVKKVENTATTIDVKIADDRD